MKTTSAELKLRARRKLKGKYPISVGAGLIIGAVLSVLITVFIIFAIIFGVTSERLFYDGLDSGIGYILFQIFTILFGIIYTAVMALLMPGYIKMFLNITTDQKYGISDLVFALKNKPLKFIGINLLLFLIGIIIGIPFMVVFVVSIITDFIPVMLVLLVLMYIALIVGSIVVTIYFSQCFFILIESPDKGVLQCLRESVELMKGNKGRFFYIMLSFTGMMLLGYGSMGIGLLWIMPYIQCTLTEFYLDIKTERTESVPASQVDHSYESMQNY
jgi:uncharacterized membrane protein